jgi:hypothetical protein
MGLFSFVDDIKDAADAKEVISQGLEEALDTMENMLSTEGQISIFGSTFAPEFESNAKASPEDGWDAVSAEPYSDFMGEIVEAGNQIMEAAYQYAEEILADEESYDEEEMEGFELGNFLGGLF